MTSPPPRIGTFAELLALCEEFARTGSRHVIGITGPPGSGKSSLAGALVRRLSARAVLLPMDGFHLANDVLTALGRRGRKGAPDTFDVAGYVSLLERVRAASDAIAYAPRFDRSEEIAIAAALAIPATVPLVITEGNYLLHRGDGWERVRPLLDSAWYLDVTEAELRSRLIARRLAHGDSAEAATAWVDDVDLPNARTVAATQARADAIMRD